MYKCHNVRNLKFSIWCAYINTYIYIFLPNCLKFGKTTLKISASNRVPCFDDGIRVCRQVRGPGMVSEQAPGSAFQLSLDMASQQRMVPARY